MRGKAAALIAAGLVVFCLTLMFVVQRAHAQGAPPDDCWVLPTGYGAAGFACEHVFKDKSKCIMFKGSSPPWTSNMECKIN
jgi:hypothetical protein